MFDENWKLTLPYQPSQIVPTLTDCENRTGIEVTSNGGPNVRAWFEKPLEKRRAGSWLSRLPLTTNWKITGTFSPPCCLVFVGQDRQAWVPGPLLRNSDSKGETSE